MPAPDDIVIFMPDYPERIPFEHMCRIAGIPGWRSWEFDLFLFDLIEVVWEWWEAADFAEDAFQDADVLDGEIAKHLWAAARGFRRRGDQGAAGLLERLASGTLGRREGQHRRADEAFRWFLLSTLRCIYILGGRVKFDRPTGTGSMVDLIDALRPVLPTGFVPQWEEKAPAFIERLQTQARKRREWLPDNRPFDDLFEPNPKTGGFDFKKELKDDLLQSLMANLSREIADARAASGLANVKSPQA